MGGRAHEVGERERARVDTGGHETCDVGHVDEQERADVGRDGGHPVEVPQARIGGRATDDELGTDLAGGGGHRVVVDPFSVLAHAVGMDLVQPAREVEGHAVGQVAAVGKVHAHDPVARFEDAEVGGHVGLRTRVRLDVDVLGTGEERDRPFLRKPLGDIDELAAAVVALAGQALGVLVGQPGTLGLHDRGRHVVLARDELDLVVLAVALALHRGPQVGIEFGDRLESETGWARDGHGSPAPSCDAGGPTPHRRALGGIFPRTRPVSRPPVPVRSGSAFDVVCAAHGCRRRDPRYADRRGRAGPRRCPDRRDGRGHARSGRGAAAAHQDAQERGLRATPAGGGCERPDGREHRRGGGLRGRGL